MTCSVDDFFSSQFFRTQDTNWTVESHMTRLCSVGFAVQAVQTDSEHAGILWLWQGLMSQKVTEPPT